MEHRLGRKVQRDRPRELRVDPLPFSLFHVEHVNNRRRLKATEPNNPWEDEAVLYLKLVDQCSTVEQPNQPSDIARSVAIN